MKSNAAVRLAALFDRAQASASKAESKFALDVWARAFEIEEAGQNARIVEVTRLLGSALQEVDQVEAGLANFGVQPESVRGKLEEVRQALSPKLLFHNWSDQVPPRLNKHSALADLRGWMADVLGEDSSMDTEDIFRRLWAMVAEMEEAVLESSDISGDLRAFLLAMIDAMRKAVRDYRIRGAPALRETYVQLTVGLAAFHEEVKKSRSRAVGRVLAVTAAFSLALGHFNTIADAFEHASDMAHRIAQVAPKVAEHLQIAAPEGPRLLPPGESPPGDSSSVDDSSS